MNIKCEKTRENLQPRLQFNNTACPLIVAMLTFGGGGGGLSDLGEEGEGGLSYWGRGRMGVRIV